MVTFFKNIIKNLAVFIDFLITPFVLLSILIMLLTRKLGIHRLRLTKLLYFKFGVFPVTKHYYDPFFSKNDISSTSRSGKLPGIKLNTQNQLTLLKKLSYHHELEKFPISKIDEDSFFWRNGSFESGDAEIWFNLIRLKKPKTIIEIGSGYSTLLAIDAIEKNKLENENYSCKHICIEPYEMSWLESKELTVIRQKVEDVDLNIFKNLESNDFLFIDSSHMIKRDGDVLHEYLEILPILNKGVIVHIHDIFTPYDYPQEWVKNYLRFWNEQYLFEAFMTQNKSWSTLLSLNYLHHNYYQNLEASCIHLETKREPGSFYIQRQ
jgi:predicted O-methyltransferase YrrM